ncbi:hypothetical protein SAMN04488134_10891 [Amphibacillus marinus]|uniref:Uncharacterized protein n=1 Tax=Amphibacillus marinus TaxID=872970 RepID=A0A1H8Q9M8_9BACI|nr:hypothetical protein SAMN04488134_10891 [Amphibacillus marinus]
MKRLLHFVIASIILALALYLNLLGLMRLIPLFITLPVLFFVIHFIMNSLLHRRTFKGFK